MSTAWIMNQRTFFHRLALCLAILHTYSTSWFPVSYRRCCQCSIQIPWDPFTVSVCSFPNSCVLSLLVACTSAAFHQTGHVLLKNCSQKCVGINNPHSSSRPKTKSFMQECEASAPFVCFRIDSAVLHFRALLHDQAKARAWPEIKPLCDFFPVLLLLFLTSLTERASSTHHSLEPNPRHS